MSASTCASTLAGYVDGLVADREASGGAGTTAAAIVRPADLYAELRQRRASTCAPALSRLVWGRLDEFQPTDVVNPIDLTRFLLEGRSEARLPVGLVRGRAVPAERHRRLEAVVVPVFRRGRFDQLDEDTSPFNLLPRVPRHAPERLRAGDDRVVEPAGRRAARRRQRAASTGASPPTAGSRRSDASAMP